MLLALKINVDTYRGALQGVPRLVEILRRHQANATFCFALGPDHAGHALKKSHNAELPRGSKGISLRERYGLKTLFYGSFGIGPNIGKQCAAIIKATANSGFETAIHGWNHAKWLNAVTSATGVWTEIEMRRAHERYIEIFDQQAPGHAAPGWQMNAHALRLTQRLGYRWASDSRGDFPYLPVWNGEVVRCPQLPTTLPTSDELIGQQEITRENVHMAVLQRTAADRRSGHVYTLHAELEGMGLSDSLEKLLTGLREQGYQLVSLGQLRDTLDLASLPYHEVSLAQFPSRKDNVLVQGEEFLAQWKDAA